MELIWMIHQATEVCTKRQDSWRNLSEPGAVVTGSTLGGYESEKTPNHDSLVQGHPVATAPGSDVESD
jgi:hypothetical protein